MKRTIPTLALFLLSSCLVGCGKYNSSYSAVALVRNNTPSSSYMNFYSFRGRMVFNMNANENQELSYYGELDVGNITVYYDNGGEKTELFTIKDNETAEDKLSPLNKGDLYIIVETNGKASNGKFTFEII